MSEKINNNDEIFAPAGFDGNPSLYGEEQWIHEYANLPNTVLEEKLQRFIGVLNDPTTLPHHRKQFARLIDHLYLETTYRDAMGIVI